MEKTKVVALYDERLMVGPLKYALSTLLRVAGVSCRVLPMADKKCVKENEITLTYGPQKPENFSDLHFFSSSFFEQNDYLKSASLPKAPYIYDDIPILYANDSFSKDKSKPVSLYRGEPKTKFVSYLDIFSSAFFLLTCYEEVVKGGPLDQLGRFPASSSILKEKNWLHRSLVNEYAQLLQEWIHQVYPSFSFLEQSYHGHKFAIALTHDLDSIHKHWFIPKRTITELVVKGKLRTAAKTFGEAAKICWFKRKDPYDNLSHVVEWERRLGIRSSIYVMGCLGPNDANYDVAELEGKVPLHSLVREGWEIGFHPGYSTSTNERAFNTELATIGTSLVRPQNGTEPVKIEGGRQHFLKFKVPHTWRIWEKSGMRYDSTLGFVDHEGFRCGMCVPFKPFDLLENRILNIWEMPLTVMDCTLDLYRNMSFSQREDVLEKLLHVVKKHQGVFVMLWHNTYFGKENAGKYSKILEGFIDLAQKEGAFVGSARQVLDGMTTASL